MGKFILTNTFSGQKNQWKWQSVGAIAGLGGGVAAFVLTMTLSAFSWLTRDELAPILKEAGFVSLISVLPLLALGAHCLDLLEKESRSIQIAFSESQDKSL